MLRKMIVAGSGAVALLLASAGSASAALEYVGNWRVSDGPADFTPLSAQSVAAMLFGGSAGDYFVSLDFADPNGRQAWYFIGSTYPATVAILADDFDVVSEPYFTAYWKADPYVAAEPERFTNYVWRQVEDGGVPEPSTWALMICGFGFAGSALRRRQAAA